MRRISYWFLATLSAVVLLVGFDASRHAGTLSASPQSSAITSGSSTSGTKTSGSPDTSTRSSSKSSSAKSGGGGSSISTVTGSVVQTQWGPVQVQIAVRNATITQVRVLQYPNGNPRDVEIANYALPILIRETKQSQNAQIDMVSGATYTSQGYVQSLQSAIDQANL